MSDFKEFYSTIDDITNHIRTDFVGPISENEILEGEEPLNRYSLGILYQQAIDKCIEKVELTQVLESGDELFEEDSEESASVLNSNFYRPSSLAVSFTTGTNGMLDISFRFAVYEHSEVKKNKDTESEYIEHNYKRIPLEFHSACEIPSKIGHYDISDKSLPVQIYLHLRRINENGSKLITISATNKNKAINSNVENNIFSLFQCCLTVKNENGFLPVYIPVQKKSIEEATGDMLYSDVFNYAYGHGCSTIAIEENGIVNCIKSEFVPQYRLLQMMPRTLENASYLKMIYWLDTTPSEGCALLQSLADSYKGWLNKLKENKELISEYPETSAVSFKNIEQCLIRLQSGINCIKTNGIAWKSFVLMNHAMMLQRIKTKHCSEESVSWYPFQLAYILQIIPDIVDNTNPFHEIVDLLWFPTGGGKTEAYLGLSAFAIFYRRYSNSDDKDNDGVTIIMRYTLRLLTIQQFERATALICACEKLRLDNNVPGKEISIGLWIGSGMTPNHIDAAQATLEKMKADSNVKIYEANPIQITKCPWCGSEINIGGYSIDNNTMNIRCHKNKECLFHKHLPIYIVDDDIYTHTPTLLLSTVDKFARIAWEEKAGNLFGAKGNIPPELIIQDELHLISGPLGSITGIYEIAVDEICKHYGKTPKIIASTATVKNADRQIQILYNRDMIQFPPNGLSYKDSFFAVQADLSQRPARTYVGLCSIIASSPDMLIKLFALFVYLKCLYKKQNKSYDVIDQFFTTVGYFNSLKELGSASNIIIDRIFNEIKYLVQYKFSQEASAFGVSAEKGGCIPLYLKNDELTSRNSAQEIKNILDKLSEKFSSEHCYDYVMSSNMLSVGIDIDRLGVMCVYGQPKSNAEYIQATSRAGRTNPGIVITLYNGLRSRDKSYYEQFDYYHRTFYKYVESTSVTSYSPRAIEKALHCAFAAIIRQTIPKYNQNSSARYFDLNDPEISRIKNSVIKRVKDIEPRMEGFAGEWLDYFLMCWRDMQSAIPDRLVFHDYHNENISLFKSAENTSDTDIPKMLNSVRNVESSADIFFTLR